MLSMNFYGALLEPSPCRSTLIEPSSEVNVEMIPSSSSTVHFVVEGLVIEGTVEDCTGIPSSTIKRVPSPESLRAQPLKEGIAFASIVVGLLVAPT